MANITEKIERQITALEGKIDALSGNYLTNTWKRQREQQERDRKKEMYHSQIQVLQFLKQKSETDTLTLLEQNLTVAAFYEDMRCFSASKKYCKDNPYCKFQYLIECSHGKIIFDCGWHRNMSPDGVFDKKAQIKSLGSLPLYVTNQGRIEKGLAIDEQLAALGIHPADLDLVLLSHLDCDHTNGLNLVADAKQILVSKDELLFAENKTPVNRIRYNADWWCSTKMQTFDWNGTEGLAGKSYDVFGDESLVMVNIPGHSKGLCALKITGSDGRFILLLRRWRLRPKIVGAADHIRHCR